MKSNALNWSLTTRRAPDGLIGRDSLLPIILEHLLVTLDSLRRLGSRHKLEQTARSKRAVVKILAADEEQLLIDQSGFGVHPPVEEAQLDKFAQAKPGKLFIQKVQANAVLYTVGVCVLDNYPHLSVVLFDCIHQRFHPWQCIFFESANSWHDDLQPADQLRREVYVYGVE